MIRLVLVLAASVLFGCVAGEDGKDGEDGSGYQAFVYTGVLYESEQSKDGAALYWDKIYGNLTERSLVSVYVRQGSGYMWQEPTWYLSNTGNYIRIVDDAITNPAYEFKIIIGN